MEKIKEFFKKPIAFGIVGLAAGLALGLVVLGWSIWPVQWTDAAPSDLQMDYQRDYLCMTIDSYIRNQDNTLVQLRWEGLGETAPNLLNTLTPAVCRFSSSTEIEAFGEVINFQPAEPAEVSVSEGMSGQQEPTEEDSGGISLVPLAVLMLLTLVVGGIFVFLMIRRSKASADGQQKMKKVRIRTENVLQKSSPDQTPQAQKEPPLAQFMTTYRQGDDLYDDSFSIDSVNGEFLGECGVGVAETIGVGEPKKVTALEVWLFDKNDIQTVTKVLMSEHASDDVAIRQRLMSKGEPVVIEPGMRFVMETASLQLEARVIDMVYARGPLPENSYFSRVTLEISVWSK